MTNPIQETNTPTAMKPIEKGCDRSLRMTIAKAVWDAAVPQPETKPLPPKAGGPFQFLTKS